MRVMSFEVFPFDKTLLIRQLMKALVGAQSCVEYDFFQSIVVLQLFYWYIRNRPTPQYDEYDAIDALIKNDQT